MLCMLALLTLATAARVQSLAPKSLAMLSALEHNYSIGRYAPLTTHKDKNV